MFSFKYKCSWCNVTQPMQIHANMCNADIVMKRNIGNIQRDKLLHQICMHFVEVQICELTHPLTKEGECEKDEYLWTHHSVHKYQNNIPGIQKGETRVPEASIHCPSDMCEDWVGRLPQLTCCIKHFSLELTFHFRLTFLSTVVEVFAYRMIMYPVESQLAFCQSCIR